MTPPTPGPWKAVPRHVDNDGTQDEMGGMGWDIEGPPEPMIRGQFAKAADAYLGAAAPDLLAALQSLYAACEKLQDRGVVDFRSGALEAARAAIVRARGSATICPT